jgi:hypothetical protein
LTVLVDPQPNDSVVVESLGWIGGVPGAQVFVRRSGGVAATSSVTDASGQVEFPGLLPGVYSINVVRALSPTERALLPMEYQEVDALGGTLMVSVSLPSANAAVSVLASRRGSLVISEIWSGDPAVGNRFYDDGDFMEIYNNSESAVSLAGKLVVYGFPGSVDNPPFTTCSLSTELQRDSLGIWATFVYAFPPGAPTLAPGVVAVLATDAIDHRTITPLAYDLSEADFEFRGSADVDNPAVADMLSVGPRDGGTPFGHGLSFYNTSPVLAIAHALDLTALPRVTAAVGGEWVRIPRDAILDVVTWTPVQGSTAPSCGAPVHASLDGQQARLISNWSVDLRSITRRQVTAMPDGRAILLRTRSSGNDFIAADATPGRVP